MSTSLASWAREFEVLVARAARQGVLEPRELLPTYEKLRPGSHPHLSDARRFDLDAVVGALESLPPGILDAPSVRVVAELDGYDYASTPSPAFPAGYLDDGTLLIEAGRGLVPLINLTAPLCVLAHEADKARALLGVSVHAGDSFEEFGPEMGPEALPDIASVPSPSGPGPEPAEPEGELFDVEALKQHAAAEGDELTENEVQEANDVTDADEAAWIADAAFRLGTTQATLSDAIDQTDAAILSLFDSAFEVPELLIHVDVDPAAVVERARRDAQRLLGALAEMGLAERPLHLWIGSPVLSDCLSPYARELRGVLSAWANKNPEAVGDDIDGLPDNPGENLLYALSHDLLASRDGLAAERANADRTVGIQRHGGEFPFELIDLGRIDSSLCDARLVPGPLPNPAPVVVRLTTDVEDDQAAGLRALLEAIGQSVRSVTVVLEGTTLHGDVGSIVLPHLLLRWAGEEKVAIPRTRAWELDEVASLNDAPVTAGAVLSVTSAALLAPDHITKLASTYGVAAVEVGGSGLIAALADARFRGLVPPETELSWALVGSRITSTGRPHVGTVAGCASLAIALLRRLLTPPEPPREKAPEPKRREGPSPRAMYIKA